MRKLPQTYGLRIVAAADARSASSIAAEFVATGAAGRLLARHCAQAAAK
jgi:hypothetical protein